VRDYLISQGVASSRIDILSKGEKNPSADNSTAAGRVQNRRVEIKVK
jgi:OOP family OmpA-OmpF porin